MIDPLAAAAQALASGAPRQELYNRIAGDLERGRRQMTSALIGEHEQALRVLSPVSSGMQVRLQPDRIYWPQNEVVAWIWAALIIGGAIVGILHQYP